MKVVTPTADWPDSWRQIHRFDLVEVFGDPRAGRARAYRIRMDVTQELVARATPQGGTVLDVAAAQGNLTLRLAERGYRVTWNDLRADLEGYVRLKHEHGTVAYVSGNVLEVEAADQFDTVVAGEVIEHVAHPDRFLATLATLVRPGGHIVLTTPLGSYLRNRLPRFGEIEDPDALEPAQFAPDADGHLFLLGADELQSMAIEAGLRVVDLRVFNNSLTAGHMKLEGLGRVLPARTVDALERLTQRLPWSSRRRLNSAMAALLLRPG